jgi:hypothetical protein
MSLPSFLPDEATWMFHVGKAHLTDLDKHTACRRILDNVDPPSESWNGESHKCITCAKFEQRQREGSGSK